MQIFLSSESDDAKLSTRFTYGGGGNAYAPDPLFSFLSENCKLLERVTEKLYDEVWPSWRDHRILQISLRVADAEEMARINSEFRKVAAPTDVLTFPLFEREGVFCPPAGMMPLPLGDILICPPVIRANAALHALSEESAEYAAEREAALVLFHGMLHLLAWDHDDAESREKMWGVQERFREIFLRLRAGRNPEFGG